MYNKKYQQGDSLDQYGMAIDSVLLYECNDSMLWHNIMVKAYELMYNKKHQQGDSLSQYGMAIDTVLLYEEIRRCNDSLLRHNMMVKAYELMYNEKYQEAQPLLIKLVKIADSTGNYADIAKMKIFLGDIQVAKNVEDSAIMYYVDAMVFAEKTKDVNQHLIAVYSIGDILFKHQLYNTAIRFFTIADSLILFSNLSQYRVLVYEKLGDSYFENRQYDQASFAYFELLRYSKQYQQMEFGVKARKRIAECYAQQGDYSSALAYELNVIPSLKMLRRDLELAEAFFNIATCYVEMKQYRKVIEYCYFSMNTLSDTDSLLLKVLKLKLEHSVMRMDESDYLKSADRLEQLAKQHNKTEYILESEYLRLKYYYVHKDNKLFENHLIRYLRLVSNSKEYTVSKKVYSTAIRYYTDQERYNEVAQYQVLYMTTLLYQLEEYDELLVQEKNIAYENKKMKWLLFQKVDIKYSRRVRFDFIR
jgi:tetratricopeptide (TPR) repeat protein